MIEQGIQILVQADATVASLCATGGFSTQLPKGIALPSWTQTLITEPAQYHQAGVTDLKTRTVQIDVYGDTAASCMDLAAAIDAVLSGARAQLTDDDALYLQSCFRMNLMEFFETEPRNFRRMLEYDVTYSVGVP